ncbi:unnamed protein product [Gongylonema pulchrum]|uniref:Clat_adaptor_s domain-containing protein n=1 Tax=Gongylonema pulchrum TaxID=637853 RepID=A0A183DMT7_9BILA|nr:unnamed protein product [Gongylonema pulchrum]
MVVEFLHRVIATFTEYFDDFSDSAVKENCVMVFELLDEMLDNGFPLATELNVLQELIKPPNFLRTIANQVIFTAILDNFCITLKEYTPLFLF